MHKMVVRKLKRKKILFIKACVIFSYCSYYFQVFFLTAGIFAVNQVTGQNQDTYSLPLQGFVWNHSTLNALVVTADNESWWTPSDLNTALRAIGQWNDAIAAFSSNYSDYSYLSNLRIQPTVSNQTQLGFDIYVNWTESPFGNTNEVGLSQISANYRSVIINCTVNLASRDHHGDPYTEYDKQNIALHELGHSLGLGHSNSTSDLMYAYYSTGSSGEAVSTLDVYGVATLFAWELNTTNFYPVDHWLKENSVVLPSGILDKGLPVSPENVLPETLANNPVVQTLVLMFEILIHPEIFSLIVVFIAVFVIIALIPSKRKRGKAVKADS
jgi:hypothetical protein